MGRHDHEQRSQHSVRKDKTAKDKEKERQKETPRRGRKHQSCSPSIVTPRRTQSDGCDVDLDHSIQPPSEPSLANLDNKLDKVIQLQLNAQARIADLEKVIASHDVSLRELGPINRSLADLSQKVEDMDSRLVQTEQKLVGQLACRLPLGLPLYLLIYITILAVNVFGRRHYHVGPLIR